MKLICPECRRENEPERIYCHDCGARLDRSALAKQKPTQEDPKDTQRRLRHMLDPQRALLRKRFFDGSKLVLGAFLAAALVQMLRCPDLPEPEKTPMLPVQINLDLENAAMDPRVGPIRYSDEQVNAYLAYTLKGKQAALSKYLQFKRAIVSFEEGYCRITAERSLFTLPLCTTAAFAASLENGKIVATNRGGSIGRLPVHPALMQYGGVLFADVRNALDRERRSIVKLGSVEFHPKTIFFTPKES
ncbi:MAG: hypothetical protein ABR589_11340 [Chthoniobacterales bacterium]